MTESTPASQASLDEILAEQRKTNELLEKLVKAASDLSRVNGRWDLDGAPVPQATKPKANPAAEPGLYDSVARIEIRLTKEGRAYLGSQFMGEFDSSYAHKSDERLLGVEVPKLLAELRQQIQESFGSATTS
jgi:hypothetical protein